MDIHVRMFDMVYTIHDRVREVRSDLLYTTQFSNNLQHR